MYKKTQNVCRQTTNNRCSVLQDLTAHTKTEIDHINGALIQHAKRYDMEAPCNQTLYALVKAMEQPAK